LGGTLVVPLLGALLTERQRRIKKKKDRRNSAWLHQDRRKKSERTRRRPICLLFGRKWELCGILKRVLKQRILKRCRSVSIVFETFLALWTMLIWLESISYAASNT
jgi:hypothetical protein